MKVKKEIIAKHENGVRVSYLTTQFGMAKSTICTILKELKDDQGSQCCKKNDSFYLTKITDG